jgi:hypothetical protein
MLLIAGRTDVEKLIAGDVDGKPFTQIVVGTSSTAVAETDTALTGAFAKDITTVNYFTDGHVQFNTLLESADAAMTIQEVGLLNSDGVLCYRKVVPAISKVVGVTLAVQYKIKVQ